MEARMIYVKSPHLSYKWPEAGQEPLRLRPWQGTDNPQAACGAGGTQTKQVGTLRAGPRLPGIPGPRHQPGVNTEVT